MRNKFTFPFLILISLGLTACEEERTLDSSACFSLDYNRYQLGKFIIDTPPGVSAYTQFDSDKAGKEKRRDAFVNISSLKDSVKLFKERSASGKATVIDCQLKAFVPYPAGNELSITYNQSSMPKEQWLRNREATIFDIALPEVFEKYPATSYKRKLQDNLFKVDEIANIKAISDIPETSGNPKQTAFRTTFFLGDRKQQISCGVAGCSELAFQDEDGLVYLIAPKRFNWKNYKSHADIKDLNNFNIVAAEDLPENVVPVLNFARKLRNQNAEGTAQ